MAFTRATWHFFCALAWATAAARASADAAQATLTPPARRLEEATNASGVCCVMTNYTDACECREEDYSLWSSKAARSPEACNATGRQWCETLDHTSDDAILEARCEAYGTDCKSGVCCIMDGSGYDSPCDCDEADFSLWSTAESRSADACRSTPGRDWCATLDHTNDEAIRDLRCEKYGTDCESGVCCIMNGLGGGETPIYEDACDCRVPDYMYWASDQARSRRECNKVPGLEWCASKDHTSDNEINEARCIVYGMNCGASLFPGLGSFTTDDDADDDPSGICCHLKGFQGTRSYADACECRIADYYQTISDDGPGSSEVACNATAEASWCPSIDHPGDLLIKEAQCFVYGLCDIGRDPIPDPPTPAPTITPMPSPKPTSRPTRAPTTPEPTRAPTTEPTSTDGALPRHAVELAVAVAAFVAYLVI
jgi:hypothetical protein